MYQHGSATPDTSAELYYPLFVVLASSSATADAISSARFAAVLARVAADSAVLLLCAAAVALPAPCRLRGCCRGAALRC